MDPVWTVFQGAMLILVGSRMVWNGYRGIKPGTEPQILSLLGNLSPGEKMSPGQQTSSIGWGSANIGLGTLILVLGIARVFRGH